MRKGILRFLIFIHYWINRSGIKIIGLGWLQKLLKEKFVFGTFGKKFQYDPQIEGSYDYLLIGRSNEPETHQLLDRVMQKLPIANFIDVGASVGEFVFGVSRYKNVQHIYAFEPRPDCAEVLRKNVKLNKEERIVIFENALDNIGGGELVIHLNAGGSSSGIYSLKDKFQSKTVIVKTMTLDVALPFILQNTVLLIDVEGAEPLVLEGGRTFIQKNKPLIIFEYNQTSKKHFHLDEIDKILGSGYELFRLNGDGNLDQDFSNSWNCVAIPENCLFKEVLSESIKK